MPQKAYEPTEDDRELVKGMCLAGISHTQQALVLGIDRETLEKHYRYELDTTEPKAIQKVANSLYKQCLEGNTTAIIFYLKTRARWRENNSLEITGPNGAPLVSYVVEVKHELEQKVREAEAIDITPEAKDASRGRK